MTAPWATAHVDAELDWNNIDDQLVRRLERSTKIASRAAQKNFNDLEKSAGRSFSRMAGQFDQAMARMRSDSTVKVDVEVGVDGKAARTAKRQITLEMEAAPPVVKPEVDDTKALAQARTSRARMQALLGTIKTRIEVDKNSDKAFSNLGRSVGSATGTLAKWGAVAGTAALAVGSLLPATVALGAALATVGAAAGGVMVAGLATMGVVMASLKVATAGMGDALKNAFDPTKAAEYEQALAKLTPAAQATVVAIKSLGDQFTASGAKAAVQTALFAGVGAQLARLNQFLPAVKAAMVGVAEGFNQGARSALTFVNSAAGVRSVSSILGDTSAMGATLGKSIGNLVPGLLALAQGAASAFRPFTTGVEGSAKALSDMLVKAQQSGKITAFFAGAIQTAKQFWQILTTLGSALGGVFKAAAAAGGGNPLGGILQSLAQVSAWTNSMQGQNALTTFFTSAREAMGAIVPVFLQIAQVIGTTVAPIISDLAQRLGPVLVPAVRAIGEGIRQAAPQIAFFGEALAHIIQWITPLLPMLVRMAPTILLAVGAFKAASAASKAWTAAQLILNNSAIGRSIVLTIQMTGHIIRYRAAQVAAAAGTKLWTAATKAGAVAMRLFGVALRFAMGPIGLIITAVALIATAIWAFFTKTDTGRKLWDKIWNGIKATVAAVWNWLKPVFEGIKNTFTTVVDWIKSKWEPIKAVFASVVNFIRDHWRMILPFIMGPLGIVIGLVTKYWDQIKNVISIAWNSFIKPAFGFFMDGLRVLGNVVMWLWQTVIQPAFNAIGTVISWVWNNIIKPAWDAFKFGLQILGNVVMWLWNNVITPAWNAIGSIISTVWNNVISPIWNAFKAGIDLVGQAAMWLWQNVIVPAWNGIRDAISFAWNNVISPIWDKFKAGLDLVGSAAGTFKDILVGAWNSVKDAVSSVWNFISGVLSKIESGMSKVGNVLSKLNPFGGKADGGPVVGYETGGPVVNALASGGQPRRARAKVSGAGGPRDDKILSWLSNGEFVEPARAVNSKTLPLLEALRRGWVPSAEFLSAMYNDGQGKKGDSAGEIPRFAGGGAVSTKQLIDFARGLEGKPYVWGGVNWGDCSGAMSALANYATGQDPFSSRFATGSEKAELEKRGFKPGLGPSGSFNIGWFNGGPYGGHTAGTLPDGTNVEMGGNRGNGQFGGQAAGAGDSEFTDHAHLPPEFFTGLDAGSKTSGSVAPTSGGGTPIGSGIGGSGGSSGSSSPSWGNSGGGSKANSASEAKTKGLTPVWVENWPASIGGGSGSSSTSISPTSGNNASISPTSGGATASKDLRKGASKEDIAAAIVAEGKRRNLSDDDIKSAVATGIVETGLKNYANSNVADSLNLPHDKVGSDHDSVGVFQQRQTWGKTEDLMDPTKAAGKYYDALTKVQGKDSMTVGQRAQAVQRSAFPDRYDQKADEAQALIDKVSKSSAVPVTSQGTVPVTIQPTSGNTANTAATAAPTASTAATAAPTTGAKTTAKKSASMPYGVNRANTYWSENDYNGQLRDVGVSGLKSFGGEIADEFGLKSSFESGFDQMVDYLKTIAAQQLTATPIVNVAVNGQQATKVAEKKSKTGMNAVTQTYRQG